MLVGLAFSVVLIYLLIVVNFQSWLDPFVIITALPGALTGIIWALFLTDTTLSVPALTGAIMCMGTATANSILVVSFARERLAAHGDAARAAMEAGYERLRPVLMTALLASLGLLPAAMSHAIGSDTQRPFAIVIIGGLMSSTLLTMLLLPTLYKLVEGWFGMGRSQRRMLRLELK